jgi:general secretion pathway protein I
MPALLARRSLGFSLLEVMVAVAILGLTLTVILSAQGGLAASNKMAGNMGMAATLGRCKVTEIEEKLVKLGYPVSDDIQTETACCNDNLDTAFTCDMRVEKVVLPNPPSNSLDGGALSLSALASASAGPGGAPSSLAGALGSVAPGLGGIAPGLGANGAGGAGLDFDGGLQGLGAGLLQQFGGSAGGPMGSGGMGVQGLLQMVMGFVYPSMKLMFEASIRRVTVTVKWNEGPNPKELAIVEYVTSPQQAGFTAGAIPSGSAAPGASGGLPQAGGPGGFGAPGAPAPGMPAMPATPGGF